MLTDSKFGFGLMRLPKDNKGQIQIEQVKKMVDAYLATGFNYCLCDERNVSQSSVAD